MPVQFYISKHSSKTNWFLCQSNFTCSTVPKSDMLYAGPKPKASKVNKGATSPLVYLEKFKLNFSSPSFAIRVNLLHP